MDRRIRHNARPLCLRRLDVSTSIFQLAQEYEDRFREQNITIELDVPQNLWIDMDPVLMREAFRKLIDNAMEAMTTGGTLTVTSLMSRHGLEIEFADTGCGVSDELKERLFEPFATTKHDHAGLGLSLVREIAQSHQGSVSVDDCPEGGTAFTLLLPVKTASRQAA